MEQHKDPLTIIMGRAASGKDTLANQLITDDRTMVLSHTTRARRVGEGNTHIFIDSIDPYSDRWLETSIQGNHYFILEKDLYQHDILLIDVKGFLSLVADERFTRPYQVLYMDVPMPIRRERYMKRENVSEQDFIYRNSDEDLQFTDFEELIEDPEFREKHQIEIIKNDTDIKQVVQKVRNRDNL